MAGDALRITAGPAAGGEIVVDTEVLFGREAGGIGLLGNDPELSRRHARVHRTPAGTLEIEDLGSSNGTFVNGLRVTTSRPLSPGDTVTMGTTTLEVAVPPATASDATEVRRAVDTAAAAPVPAPPPPPAPAAAGVDRIDPDDTAVRGRPAILQLRLNVVTGADAGREITVSSVMVVGRDQAADIMLDDPEVSRRHAQFTPVDDTALIEDLGSANGTYVNGEPLTSRRRLRTKDRIVCGETVLEVRIPSHEGKDSTAERTIPQAAQRNNGIEVEGLVRVFDDYTAVDAINLTVEPGEIYGFLGPNGAGKSTTVHMLTTLLPPSGGTARVAGHDVLKEGPAVRRNIGVALQAAALDPYMNAWEHMSLQTTLQGVPKAERRRRAEELIERVGLTDAADRRVGSYSGGMKRRLDLALALVHGPGVIFLDEPTTGLDPQSRSDLWEEVRRLAKDEGVTVFLTTQYLEEADVLADRVGIIDGGKLVAEDTPDRLKKEVGRPTVVAYAADPAERPHLQRVLHAFGEPAEVPDRVGVSVRLREGIDDLAAIVRSLDAASIRVERLDLHSPTLDDVFLAKTGHSLEEQQEAQEESIRSANASVSLPGQPIVPPPPAPPLVPR